MSTAYVRQIADSPAFFISPGRSTSGGSGLRSAGVLAKVGWPSWLCMSMEIVSSTILATRGSIASCPHAFVSMEGPNRAAPPAAVRPCSSVRRDCEFPCFICIVPGPSAFERIGDVLTFRARCNRRLLVDNGVPQHTDLLDL